MKPTAADEHQARRTEVEVCVSVCWGEVSQTVSPR